MDRDQLREIFLQVQSGAMDVEHAVDRMRHMPFEDVGFAEVAQHRELRHGMPEVIFAKGKAPEQVTAIAATLLQHSQNVLITRADRACADMVTQQLPDGEYLPLSGAIRFWRDRKIQGKGPLALVCAGTSDMPVAEEAQVTAELMGNQVDTIHDIGVAGIQRRRPKRQQLCPVRRVVGLAVSWGG